LNLDNSLAFFINQGPVFWAATAAVGAGGALLITSLFVALRRFFSRTTFQIRFALPNRRRSVKLEPTTARPDIQVTDTGYALAARPSAAEPTGSVGNSELSALLKRLQAAGNLLEEALPMAPTAGSTYSPLKARVAMVEQETSVGVA